MIDTIAWRVILTQQQADMILKRSKEYSEFDHETNTTNFRILKDNLHIGSYDSNITIKCFEDLRASVEFSLPKQHFGNNVELLYPSQLEQALGGVYARLVDHFGDFPHYRDWFLQRLDLCYGWKYASQAFAKEALNVLKTFDYSRKSKYLYPESVMWRGKTSSIKFYLKQNEYLKHDYKKLIKLGQDDFAKRILVVSEGVLRFEITFRKPAIDYLFKNKHVTYKDILSKEFLERILGEYLGNLTMNLDKVVIDDKEALRRLKQAYPLQKAMRLFSFFKLYNSPKLNYRQIFKDHYNSSTIWRNKRDIANAKVGLPNDKSIPSFELNIPSDLVVNKEADTPCVSREAA